MNINSILFQYASIGDYLFLIMIVVASIIQTIAQNKKKKAMQELASKEKYNTNNRSKDVIENDPEIMTSYEATEDTILNSLERILVPEQEVRTHIWGDDYLELPNENINPNEEDRHFEKTENTMNRVIDQKPTETIPSLKVADFPDVRTRTRSRIRDGFTLRKAVVYSEILNRKYN